ncbi:MAG TPA: AraC family transcriptional regulator, partial [Porphyromonadaceae bacterium]|nr:AraC family transcriptional regulator [Porphyromonadaceae bacterium]
MVVHNEMEKLGFNPKDVVLGEVLLEEELSDEQKEKVRAAIEPLGFELIDDRKSRIIEKIKNVIIDLVHRK